MALYDDPIESARRRMIPRTNGQSFFPAVNQRMFSDRGDLLGDIEGTFYGGGNAPPTPTPTPTPAPRSYFGGIPSTFQIPSLPSSPLNRPFSFGLGMNRFNRFNQPQYDFNNLQSLYGWSGLNG